MYFLAYLSSAAPKLDEDILIDILIASRRRNSESNITGLLLFIEEKIVQIIEGDEHDVIQLFSKIEQDRRHYSIVKIAEGNIPDRMFNGWAMGFKTISCPELESFTGISNISKETFSSSDVDDVNHPAVKVLKAFYENYQKNS